MVFYGESRELLHLDVRTSETTTAARGRETQQGRPMCLHGRVCQTNRLAQPCKLHESVGTEVSGRPAHHHEPLAGFALNFHGNKVFKTALAAEYPQGLCIELAKAYAKALEESKQRPDSWKLVFKEDAKVMDLFSKKAQVEQENELCIGGSTAARTTAPLLKPEDWPPLPLQDLGSSPAGCCTDLSCLAFANLSLLLARENVLQGGAVRNHRTFFFLMADLSCLNVELHKRSVYVKVMVTTAKLEEWRVLLERLNTQPLVGRKPLQQFTGKMSWAAGFIPQLKPFVRMLYAALATNPSKLQGQGQIYFKQIEPALHWIRRFLWSWGPEGLERTVFAYIDINVDLTSCWTLHLGAAVL